MMKEVNVISGEQTLNGEKIRLIEYNNNKYFLYTLNEKDEEGYEKVYVNKIIDNEEDLITELEWDELKKNIPTIVKEIRNKSIMSFKDLSLNDIKRGNLNYAKAFKLKVNIVDSIKKEETEEKNNIHKEINNLIKELNSQEKSISQLDSFLDNVGKVEKPVNPENKIGIELEEVKKELVDQKKENEKLKRQILEQQMKIDKYRSKLEQIKIMIEQS